MHHPLRLTVDRAAIQSNWRWLARSRRGRGGGRGQGRRLWPRRARDDRSACSRRAAATSSFRPGPRRRRSAICRPRPAWSCSTASDRMTSRRRCALPARPVLNTRRAGGPVEGDRAGPAVRRDDRHRHQPARPAARRRSGALDGLAIDTLHSHLACADEDHALNAMQLERFRAIAGTMHGQALQPRQLRRHLPRPRL